MAVAEAQLIGDLRDAHGSILQQLLCNACLSFQKIVVGGDAVLHFEGTDQMGLRIKEIFDNCVEWNGKVGHSVQPVLQLLYFTCGKMLFLQLRCGCDTLHDLQKIDGAQIRMDLAAAGLLGMADEIFKEIF